MTDLSQLKFYATHPHPCSYLPREQATTLFLDPQQPLDVETYSELSEMGFRRSGDHLYRPHCRACNACIPARIPVAEFEPNSQQKRILKKNRDLHVTEASPEPSDEIYDLYQRYICARHADGDMYPPSRDQFQSFLVKDWNFCRFFTFRDPDNKLLAVAVTDQMVNGISAVYTFFDPQEHKRSLGRFAILWQIQHTRDLEMDSVYLGYWIKDCRKMNYKTEYRPIEMLVNQRWVRLT
ncbi:arginyltransferase [Pseudomonas neustonica]|uniref:Aspartate/glutamate leucyltransferase n=1 Tax=Pseudomonas neustonica TaxID=2487346 RepID=A0ABX9XH39_9PSED|nr:MULTISPECIES: arginyltransferase [Pseudomonas]ROZ82194.1 arginyltransferase [Pseudomonas sp. SSM44]ROZ84074.1 arginyltransferase [Pseudomonas neustonica]|tara:strand:- start:2363 stop:3073 length:711 start_codon:yes stop_codon:yes gene_type:complete